MRATRFMARIGSPAALTPLSKGEKEEGRKKKKNKRRRKGGTGNDRWTRASSAPIRGERMVHP